MNHSNNSNNNLTTNSSKTSEQSQNGGGGGGGGGGYHHLQNGGGGGNINGISASMANKLNLATAAAMALTNGHHHHPHHHYNNNSGDEYVGSGYNKHHHHHHQQHHHQQHHHHQLHHQQQQQQHHMMAHNQQHPQWYDIEIKGLVKNISPKLWQWTHLMRLCLNDNNLVRLPPLVSNLVNLQYLDLSNNKIRTLPAEIGDMTCLRELYLNYNQLRVLPFELGKLFKLHQLGLKGNPLTTDIMQIYSEPNGTSKLLISLLDQLSITCSPPPRRPWMILAEPNPSANSCIFTTMCYNVLCDKYATRQYYGYCPAWALAWDYRKKLILDEIKNFNADIICLQELETEQFYQYFLPELKVCDYDGIFSAKSRAKTMSEQDKKHVDGCAIFFKTTRFQLVKDYLIEFNQIAMAAAEGSEDMLNRVMTKDNIGLAALLEVKQDDSSKVEGTSGNTTNPTTNNTSSSSSTGSNTTSSSSSSPNSINKQLLLVSTAHIHWDPEYCDVKLIQTLMFTNELRGIIEQAAREFQPQRYMVSSNGSNGNSNAVDCSNCIPLVVCADLNSLPESGVIEYLRTGRILANHVDFKDLGYDSCLQRINTSDRPSELSHNLKLDCAYDKDLMPYTNYTYDFKGMIDYIFYSSQLMRTVGLLGPLDSDWIKGNKIVGFPHPHVPSDHLPLMVELELVNPNLSAMNANSYFGSSSCSSSSSLSFNSGYQQSSSGSNLRSALPHHHQQHSNSTNQPSASLLSSSPSSLNSSNLSNSNNILSTNNFNYMRK